MYLKTAIFASLVTLRSIFAIQKFRIELNASADRSIFEDCLDPNYSV